MHSVCDILQCLIIAPYCELVAELDLFTSFYRVVQARIQRGDRGSGPPPPPRFVRGGVLCTGLMGRRGGPTVVLPYYYLFFLARFARQYYTKVLHIYICTMIKVQYENGHPFSIFPLSK